jgi:hypothetical protein
MNSSRHGCCWTNKERINLLRAKWRELDETDGRHAHSLTHSRDIVHSRPGCNVPHFKFQVCALLRRELQCKNVKILQGATDVCTITRNISSICCDLGGWINDLLAYSLAYCTSDLSCTEGINVRSSYPSTGGTKQFTRAIKQCFV